MLDELVLQSTDLRRGRAGIAAKSRVEEPCTDALTNSQAPLQSASWSSSSDNGLYRRRRPPPREMSWLYINIVHHNKRRHSPTYPLQMLPSHPIQRLRLRAVYAFSALSPPSRRSRGGVVAEV
jgi:hypothetical protein